nr:MAG TPA: hypothetical protein [Bacteriophage sp.]
MSIFLLFAVSLLVNSAILKYFPIVFVYLLFYGLYIFNRNIAAKQK